LFAGTVGDFSNYDLNLYADFSNQNLNLLDKYVDDFNKNNSIMNIRGIERRIVSFSKDTLLLENPISKVKDTLIKNCN
jgi:hypothetical protein